MNGRPELWSGRGAWLRANLKIVLLGLNALVLALLLYSFASELAFEITTRRLLKIANQIEKRAKDSHAVMRSAASGAETSATIAQATTATATLEDKRTKEIVAKLERRALFGERRPEPYRPKLEAVLGGVALVDGQWLGVGGKMGGWQVSEIEVDEVTVEDGEGNRQELALVPGGLRESAAMALAYLRKQTSRMGRMDETASTTALGAKRQKGPPFFGPRSEKSKANKEKTSAAAKKGKKDRTTKEQPSKTRGEESPGGKKATQAKGNKNK